MTLVTHLMPVGQRTLVGISDLVGDVEALLHVSAGGTDTGDHRLGFEGSHLAVDPVPTNHSQGKEEERESADRWWGGKVTADKLTFTVPTYIPSWLAKSLCFASVS